MKQFTGPAAPSEEAWKDIGQQLSQAFKEIGFVYLTNHGIPENVVRKCFN